ncbi:outer membrane receptor for ferrienterochelin and colicin [Pedobacter psychrotolerans]|uniref:Outer membrane receptor for ferrienterochelin and colicin n=1 Tax=Pedobacter psychrotolerans TaxID=1843235 RepID=A0A4R2H611_9SPHI|nr:outer membrane beta-barrel family protein [Pedobacter psychrotolerans]TCO21457.1 outer membrane receptor for ferrienterochelin and colicin [Pedobacter psychrotolerans]GGE38805.1 TonB-dependent receptor [Pedobacter psychrotolerans]
MSRYLTILCIVLQCSFTLSTLQAQEKKYQISGVIVDSLTQKPGEYFTVALKKDSVVIKSAVSNEQGKFSFDGIGQGKYKIIIGSLGYRSKQLDVNLKDDLNLGKILVVSSGNELNEVSVAGSKPIIKQEPDRIIYDIQSDPESKVLSVLDMMRKVPLLSVDADDNVKLKGAGNYRILINGKPSGILTRDPKEFLKSMPAAGVQKIEVITTPPSKYESEGLAGIINIITSKKMENGYSGNVNVRNQFPGGPSGNLNFTIKQGNFGASLYGGTGVWQVDGVKITDMRNSRGTAIASSLYSLGTQKTDNQWAWGGGEFSYELDSLNLVTLEVNPYGGYNEQNLGQHFDIKDGAVSSGYDLESKTRYEWRGTDYTLNYQKGFKNKKEHLLTFSYKLFDSSEPQLNDVMFSNRLNYTGLNYKQDNTSKSKEQTAQIDYINPFKKLTIEAGVKAILRNGESNFQYLNFNEAQQIYINDPSQSNVYTNDQNIFGIYNTYTLKLKDWTFKGGARLERTDVTGNFESTNSTVKSDYYNLIPSVSLNRTLKNSQSISLGFTQRIQRPGIWDLNPFVDKSRPNFEYYGNPDLKAALSNNFEMTYSNFKKGSLNLSLTYNFANNTQQQVYEYFAAENLTRITSYNIGKNKLLGTNANFNYPITGKWNLNVSANLNYIWLEGMISGVLTKNNGVTGYANFNTSYKFEKNWKSSISINYGAPDVMLQGKSNDSYYIALSGSKDIIKDKLIFSALVANPFQKYRAYRSYNEGVNFTQERIRENPFRRVNLSMNWKFGKLKGSIKKSERSITNDDTKKSSN